MWISSETARITRIGKRGPWPWLAVYARMGRTVHFSTVFANRVTHVVLRRRRMPSPSLAQATPNGSANHHWRAGHSIERNDTLRLRPCRGSGKQHLATSPQRLRQPVQDYHGGAIHNADDGGPSRGPARCSQSARQVVGVCGEAS